MYSIIISTVSSLLDVSLNTLICYHIWLISCLQSTCNVLCQITTCLLQFHSTGFLPFCWDGTYGLFEQRISVISSMLDFLMARNPLGNCDNRTYVSSRESSQNPRGNAQFAHVHQVQLLAEFCPPKLCCFVELRNKMQAEVLWDFIQFLPKPPLKLYA